MENSNAGLDSIINSLRRSDSVSSSLTLLNSPPLFVESGDLATVIWVYEVRTELVASDETSTGEIIANKSHQFTKPNKPIHKLYLTFSKGKLSNWGQYDG